MNNAPQRLTVIVPAYNEAELLPACLAALLPQARVAGAEVVVIDNASTDQTVAVAQAAGARVEHEPRRGVVYALQHGLHLAMTDIVAFTDADTIVDERWVATILQAFTDPQTVAVTGPVRFRGMRFLTWSRQLHRHQLLGSNMAVRRSAGLRVGGFDDRFNLASDIAFGWAIKRLGRIRYIPSMHVTTSSRRFQAQPVRQSLRYILNHVWMSIFHQPLFWHFAAIRLSEAELEHRANRRTWVVGTTLVVAALLYLSLWPSSSVFGRIAVHGSRASRQIALTFDDGPNGESTRAIVDILQREQVPATFFEVGRSVVTDPTTARYVVDHGFTIGNHSWDHSFNLPYDSPRHIRDELQQTNQTIFEATGQRPTYFRPPHGFRSPQLLYEASQAGLRVVDWSVDPQDYYTGNAQTITQRVLRSVRSGRIILLHDGLQDGLRAKQLHDRAGTIEALPKIIEQLRKRGYTFVTLDTLLQKPVEVEHDIL